MLLLPPRLCRACAMVLAVMFQWQSSHAILCLHLSLIEGLDIAASGGAFLSCLFALSLLVGRMPSSADETCLSSCLLAGLVSWVAVCACAVNDSHVRSTHMQRLLLLRTTRTNALLAFCFFFCFHSLEQPLPLQAVGYSAQLLTSLHTPLLLPFPRPQAPHRHAFPTLGG